MFSEGNVYLWRKSPFMGVSSSLKNKRERPKSLEGFTREKGKIFGPTQVTGLIFNHFVLTRLPAYASLPGR